MTSLTLGCCSPPGRQKKLNQALLFFPRLAQGEKLGATLETVPEVRSGQNSGLHRWQSQNFQDGREMD